MTPNTNSREYNARLDDLQKRTGYAFSDITLLKLAFVQRSARDAHIPRANNERLEFLGDAAIGLLVGSQLYSEYPDAGEGFMTIERSKLVCGGNLSTWGYEAGFDRLIVAGDGVPITDAMVGDAVEAVAGAYYLDGGLGAVASFLQSFRDYPDQGTGFDARHHLERDCAYEKLGAPRYATKRDRGKFGVKISVDGQEVGVGSSSDREEAERIAARDAMLRLNEVSEDERKKRALVLRARFRRAISASRKTRREGESRTLHDAETLAESSPVVRPPEIVSRDGVEYSVTQTGAAHKPIFTVTAQLADGDPISVQAATKKEALRAAYQRTASSCGQDEAAQLKDVDLAALRTDNNLKQTLQNWCERLKLGQPEYEFLPELPGKKTVFFVVLKLNGETVTSASALSKRAAMHHAAWKAMQLLAAEATGLAKRLDADSADLANRLESCAIEILPHEKTLTWKTQSCDGDCSSASLMDGERVVAAAVGLDSKQARILTLVKAITEARLWKSVLAALDILKVCESADNFRPDWAWSECCRLRHKNITETAALTLPGERSSKYRIGMFKQDELISVITAPSKKMPELWLALQMLDSAAREKDAPQTSVQPRRLADTHSEEHQTENAAPKDNESLPSQDVAAKTPEIVPERIKAKITPWARLFNRLRKLGERIIDP